MRSLDLLSAIFRRHSAVRRVGRIQSVESTSVHISGLSDVACVGHRVALGSSEHVQGEVVKVTAATVQVLLDGETKALRIGEPVRHLGQVKLYPSETWLGRVIDGSGAPVDGKPLVQGSKAVSIDNQPPSAVSRRSLGGRLATGYALFNTLLPLVRGQRLGLFSGSGVGKSSLMAAFAREVEADIVIIALIGERGREVNHFVKSVLGQKGLQRSVVVASTSDQSPLSRRQAALSAMSIAEYFRDQGRHVLLLLDSVTRLAEAHREIATVSGEPMSMRGFPASLTGLLAGFSERAGPGANHQGDITAVFTVLVSGSDMEEPVADTLRGLLDGHVVLSREIAERGRFPAADVLQSVSRSLPEAATQEENELILSARQVMSTYEESEIMVRSGLYQQGTNPKLDRAIALYDALDAFATERDADVPASFARLSSVLCLEEAAVPEHADALSKTTARGAQTDV
ncbi:MAG: FliI/YscN family ATPase [Pseudomonadota bacterium]